MLLGITQIVIAIFVLVFVVHFSINFAFSRFNKPNRFISIEKYSFKYKLVLNLMVGLLMAIGLYFLHDKLGMEDIKDASLDLVTHSEIPSIIDKKIPAFAILDIDKQTNGLWDGPSSIPKNKVHELIEVAVKGKARLIIVDVDLSQKTYQSSEQGEQHPDDKALYDYIANYKATCQADTCPPIILDRAYHLVGTKKKPIYELQLGFLEPAAANSAPYIQWAAPLLRQSTYDDAVRRWKLWEHVCTPNEEPGVIPATQLLAAAMIRIDTPQVAVDNVNMELARFKREVCGDYDVNIADTESSKQIEIAGGMDSIFQRIVYHLSWEPAQSIAKNWVMRYSKRDAGKGDLPSKLVLTVFSAQPYLDSGRVSAGSKLDGKIVVISSSYRDNLYATPLDVMPSGLVIVNALHSLLQYGEIRSLINWFWLLWLIVFIVALTFIFDFFRDSFLAIVISGVVVVVLIPVSAYLFVDGFWLNFVLPLLAVHVSQVLADYQRFDLQKIDLKQKLAKECSAQFGKDAGKLLSKQLEEMMIGKLSDTMSKFDETAEDLMKVKVSSVNESGNKKQSD